MWIFHCKLLLFASLSHLFTTAMKTFTGKRCLGDQCLHQQRLLFKCYMNRIEGKWPTVELLLSTQTFELADWLTVNVFRHNKHFVITLR